MKLKSLFILLPLLVVGCVGDDLAAAKQAARQGVFPKTLASEESAAAYTSAMFAGGRLDVVRIGPTRYLVVFRHGSGIPVIGAAVYRGGLGAWQLVAEPKVPGREFLRASIADGKIQVTGEQSKESVVIYDPDAKP